MNFIELWSISTVTFQKEPNVTNERFLIFGRKQRLNGDMEQLFRAISDLARGCDFGDLEVSIVCDVFMFNMKNEEVKKQLYMETIRLFYETISGKR